MYLLDTNVASDMMGRAPSPALAARLATVPYDRQFISSVTLAEILYGAYREPSRTDALLEKLERIILANVAVLPFDVESARRFGMVKADLGRRGMLIGDADTAIASIALVRGLAVVTRNVRHFGRVPGLAVENWFEA